MKLYHFPLSSNSRRAHMTALLVNVPLEIEIVDLAKGQSRTPDFLKLNPNGRVPVLVDGELVLWESHAIMTYLVDKHGGHSSYPADLVARADVHRWLFWSANHWSVAIAQLNFENALKRMFGMGEPDPTLVAKYEGLFKDFARVLDGHLMGREWMSGGGVTLADLSIAAPLMYRKWAKLPVDGFEHILSWFQRVEQLDVWKQTSAS